MPQLLEPPQATITLENEGDAYWEALTQEWVVRVNGQLEGRCSTYMRAWRYIHNKGYRLVDEQDVAQPEFNQYIEVQVEEIAPDVEVADEAVAPDVEVADEAVVPDVEVQAEAVAPDETEIIEKIELDSVEDEELGTVYRVWYSFQFLGTFYQNQVGKWVAQPHNCDFHPQLSTPEQAEIFVIAASHCFESLTT